MIPYSGDHQKVTSRPSLVSSAVEISPRLDDAVDLGNNKLLLRILMQAPSRTGAEPQTLNPKQ